METNPSTITPEPIEQVAEVNQALTMTDSYVDQGAAKIAQAAEIVFGKEAKTYGVTGKNLSRVMTFVGAVVTMKFLFEKASKHKWPALGTAVAVYALRTYFADKTPDTVATTNPVSVNTQNPTV